MRCALLFPVLCLVVHSKALDCGIAKVSSEKLKETLSVCVKNNETLQKIWEMATASDMSSTESKQESDSSSTEDQSQSKSGRKARETGRVQGGQIEVKERRTPEDKTTSNTTGSNESSADTTTSSSMESSETCVVRCVFEELGLNDDNGLPDHGKVVEGLLKTATGRELRVFLQESVDECFQQMDKENNLDSCAYSTKLVTCLADRGRTNCADWPVGNLPF